MLALLRRGWLVAESEAVGIVWACRPVLSVCFPLLWRYLCW